MKHNKRKASRRFCLKVLAVAACSLVLSESAGAQQIAPKKRPNVLMIVADDMNWDSPGCFGGAAPDITPNIDRLASQGMRFSHAYLNISLCTPSRSVILTGLYPQNNGAEGFQRIRPGTATLPAQLNEAGYLCGIIGKPLRQQELFRWSVNYRWQGTGDEDRWGRDPAIYKGFASSFFEMAKASQQPFFLMANSHDPHTPYEGEGSDRPLIERGTSSRFYEPGEVTVPGFLPDLPDVRKELAGYCTAVRRVDDMVGGILEELEKAGLADDTLVIFLSDNGISMPFAKSNCYVESTRTPLIIRWPGRVKAGTVEREHMVSTIDLLPTILEAVELPMDQEVDGRSFLPLLHGKKQEDRNAIFAQFNHIHGENPYPMRSIITKKHAYIFNPWSNGERRYEINVWASTFKAMEQAAENDARIADRCRHLIYRTVEEFYDLQKDPYCLNNLLAEGRDEEDLGQSREHLKRLRKDMRDYMAKYNDSTLGAFDGRDSLEIREQFMNEYTTRAKKEVEALKPYEKAQGYRF
jgi:N-sulfoglucosamine sulfohydrolase